VEEHLQWKLTNAPEITFQVLWTWVAACRIFHCNYIKFHFCCMAV
jgi:hypothetical protein